MFNVDKEIKIVLQFIHFRFKNCDIDFHFLIKKTKVLYFKVKDQFDFVNQKWVYLTCCFIILKFVNDENIYNSAWSRNFEIPLQVLNDMECKILNYINYELYKIIFKPNSVLLLKNFFHNL